MNDNARLTHNAISSMRLNRHFRWKHLLALVFSFTLTVARGDIITEPPLKSEDLAGNWQAVAESDSGLTAVYRMEITQHGESYLVEIRRYPKSVEPYLIAHLVSSQLADGKVALRFATIGNAMPFESVTIEGAAFGKKDDATISGTLVKREGNYTQTENVTFRTGSMFRALLEASEEAEATIKRQRSNTTK